MTEDEAKQKWCPYVQVVALPEGGQYLYTNRFGYVNDPWCRCLGSACMMWEPEREAVETVTGENRLVRGGGYCGMVKP